MIVWREYITNNGLTVALLPVSQRNSIGILTIDHATYTPQATAQHDDDGIQRRGFAA